LAEIVRGGPSAPIVTMPKSSKLLSALDAHKGRDYEQEKQKKLVKSANKRKREQQEGKNEIEATTDATPNGKTRGETGLDLVEDPKSGGDDQDEDAGVLLQDSMT